MNGEAYKPDEVQGEVVDAPTKTEIVQAVPQGLEVVARAKHYLYWAQEIGKSGMLPKGMQPGGALLAIQAGSEIGLGPAASLQAFVVINGRLSWMGAMALGRIRNSQVIVPGSLRHGVQGEGEDRHGFCISRRKGYAEDFVSRFSVRDAKTAKLWQKRGRDGGETPWVTFPDRQLMWRAVGFHCRDYYSDVLLGLPLNEEMEHEATFEEPKGKVQLEPPPQKDPLLAAVTGQDQTSAPAPEPPPEAAEVGTQSEPPPTTQPAEDRSPEQPEPAQDDQPEPVSPESDIDEAFGPADPEEPAGRELDPISKLYDTCQERVGKDGQALHDLWIEVTSAIAAAGDNVDAGWEKLNAHPVFGVAPRPSPKAEKPVERRAPAGPKKAAACKHPSITASRLQATPKNHTLICPSCSAEFPGRKPFTGQGTLL